MKVTVRINEFKRVLEEARFTTTSTIPALKCVKIEVDNLNQATMSSSDFGMSLVQSFEVVEGETGSFLLPVKETRDFLKRHVGGTAIIEATSVDATRDRVIVKAGAITRTFEVYTVSLFPFFPTMPQEIGRASCR